MQENGCRGGSCLCFQEVNKEGYEQGFQKGYYQTILLLMQAISIYNDGEGVTFGRRFVIMHNGRRLSALKKGNPKVEE